MTVSLRKVPPAYDYDRQAWVTGPTAAILHLHNLPALRVALADEDYRALTGRANLAAWGAACADLDRLETDCLAVLAPAVRPGCFAERDDFVISPREMREITRRIRMGRNLQAAADLGRAEAAERAS